MSLKKIPNFNEVKNWAQNQGWITSEEAPVQSVNSSTGDVIVDKDVLYSDTEPSNQEVIWIDTGDSDRTTYAYSTETDSFQPLASGMTEEPDSQNLRNTGWETIWEGSEDIPDEDDWFTIDVEGRPVEIDSLRVEGAEGHSFGTDVNVRVDGDVVLEGVVTVEENRQFTTNNIDPIVVEDTLGFNSARSLIELYQVDIMVAPLPTHTHKF